MWDKAAAFHFHSSSSPSFFLRAISHFAGCIGRWVCAHLNPGRGCSCFPLIDCWLVVAPKTCSYPTSARHAIRGDRCCCSCTSSPEFSQIAQEWNFKVLMALRRWFPRIYLVTGGLLINCAGFVFSALRVLSSRSSSELAIKSKLQGTNKYILQWNE